MVRTTTRKNVRILLVGDKLVGKTSIILSLVSEEFPEEVPLKAEEITIPADVTPELVPTHIVDYCEAEQSEESLTEEVKKAHVICVVYSVVDDNTLSRVSSYWLPLIRRCTSESHDCPIVLVGNKVDLINDSTYETASYIMDEYPEIESFVECSAKTLLNISEMFYYAQNAVLHPTSPVFNTDTQELTEACKKALTRIFTICDNDNDGVLCDKELNNFQKRCFDTPLRKEAVEDIKSIISKNIDGGVSENNGITLKGFIFLHNLFMQRGRSQTTWAVLRRFGYEENLELAKEYLCPKLVVPHGCSVELSDRGQQFFSYLFEKYDRDKDNAMSPKELKELFSICPEIPFNHTLVNMVPTNSKGWINSEGWLCFWTYTTFYNYITTLEYLAYLGYPVTDSENQTSALYVTREKKIDMLKKQSLRNVYVCHVLGEKGSGKATLCKAHLGRTMEESIEADVPNGRGTINISHVYGQEKYIILRNIDVSDAAEPLMPSDVNCDVACLVYDSSHTRSFEYVARIYLKYFENSGIPVLIIASKSDLGTVRQNYMVQPETFCQENNLLMPIMFTSLKQKKELFVKLATMAAFPGHKASGVLSESHVYNLGIMSNCEIFTIRRTGISITIIVIIGVLLAKLMKSEKNTR